MSRGEEREVSQLLPSRGFPLPVAMTCYVREGMSPGGSVSEFYGVDSEVGRLRTVLVHRPGAELRRVTPQHARGLLFAAPPWAERAAQEHDTFADALRGQDVAVLYLTELLQDALAGVNWKQLAEDLLSDP